MVTCLPEEAHKFREWLWLKWRGEKNEKNYCKAVEVDYCVAVL